MNLKPLCFLLALIFSNTFVSGQEVKTILSAPNDWNSEIIPFPLGFAPEINFNGFEDIRFAPGWSDTNSEQFWTYHFTWYIDKKESMTEELLTKTFNLYFDGLMKVVLKEQSGDNKVTEIDNTFCLFIKSDEGFTGKVRIFDAFFSKEYIILNIKVRESICSESNKQMISFNLSPKAFENDVWGIFQQVKIIEACK